MNLRKIRKGFVEGSEGEKQRVNNVIILYKTTKYKR